MKKLIVGNWKMNGSLDDARALISDIINGLDSRQELLELCDFVVCPPFVHIAAARHALHNIPYVSLGAQNCSRWENGAHTGNISAEMLKDTECSYVILGHSERRQHVGETSQIVAEKADRAHANGLTSIICVGETAEERERGKEEHAVGFQLAASVPAGATSDNTVLAYEPVWAIGTGKTATPEDVASMHAFIRKGLEGKVENHNDVRILYGGSMKPENARDLLNTPNVDGGLIGGASLNAEQFLEIAKATLA